MSPVPALPTSIIIYTLPLQASLMTFCLLFDCILFLNRFEYMLTQHEPTVSIPYWDTVLESKLVQPKDSVLFTDDLLGPNTGPLTSGPFAGHSNPEGFCRNVYGELAQREVKVFPDRFHSVLSNDMHRPVFCIPI